MTECFIVCCFVFTSQFKKWCCCSFTTDFKCKYKFNSYWLFSCGGHGKFQGIPSNKAMHSLIVWELEQMINPFPMCSHKIDRSVTSAEIRCSSKFLLLNVSLFTAWIFLVLIVALDFVCSSISEFNVTMEIIFYPNNHIICEHLSFFFFILFSR